VPASPGHITQAGTSEAGAWAATCETDKTRVIKVVFIIIGRREIKLLFLIVITGAGIFAEVAGRVIFHVHIEFHQGRMCHRLLTTGG
jgi:hypothetical protein